MSETSVVPQAEIEKAEVERVASHVEYKADLIYGASDSGKTVNIGKTSDYVLSKYGLLSRVITADGGGIGPISGLADSGQLEAWSIGAWPKPIEAFQKAMRGWWPARLDDPEAPLLAPDAGTWEIYGFYGIEGLTSVGDMVMMNLKAERASLSQDPSYTWAQGTESFSGGNRSYFGFVQDQLLAWVMMSHMLPLKKVNWTATESRGSDQDGAPIYGPAIVGKASTGKATQWFGNSLHIDIISKPTVEVSTADGSKLLVTPTERIMWLKTHADTVTRMNFPAKVRVPVAYAKEVPDFIIPPDVTKVYELIEKLQERQRVESAGKMNQVEAVRERLVKAAKVAKERAEKVAMEKKMRATVTVPSMPMGGPVGAVVGALPRPGVTQVAPTPAPIGPSQTAPIPVAPIPVAEPGHAPSIQVIKKASS